MSADSPTNDPSVNPFNTDNPCNTTAGPREAEELSAALAATLACACEVEERADRARMEVQRLRARLCEVAEDSERRLAACARDLDGVKIRQRAEVQRLRARLCEVADESERRLVACARDLDAAQREVQVLRSQRDEALKGAERQVEALRRAERWQVEAMRVLEHLHGLAERAYGEAPTATTEALRAILRAATVAPDPRSGEHLTAQGMGLDYE